MMDEKKLAAIEYNLKHLLPGPWWVEWVGGDEPFVWGGEDNPDMACNVCQRNDYEWQKGEYQVLSPGGQVVCWLDDYDDANRIARLWGDTKEMLEETRRLQAYCEGLIIREALIAKEREA